MQVLFCLMFHFSVAAIKKLMIEHCVFAYMIPIIWMEPVSLFYTWFYVTRQNVLQWMKLSQQRCQCHNYHYVLVDLSRHTFLVNGPSPLDLMCLGFPQYCRHQHSHLELAPLSQYHMPLFRPTHNKNTLRTFWESCLCCPI